MERRSVTKEKLPSWDLSALYSSIEDPKIEKDQAKIKKLVVSFVAKYKGKLNEKVSPRNILQALREYEKIWNETSKLSNFVGMVFAVDSITPENSVLEQRLTEFALSINRELIFFELQIGKLSDGKLQALANDALLENYEHYLNRQVEFKKHNLSEKEEQIFNDKSLTSMIAISKLFDVHYGQKKFQLKLGSKEVEVSEKEALDLLHDGSQERRRQAAEGFSKGLKQDSHLLTILYNTMIKDTDINSRYHNFSSPEAPRHLSNETTQTVVDAMSSAVTSNYQIVSDYYKFKRKVLKLKKLNHYDRYAPIQASKQQFSYKEAQKVVLEAFQKFDPKFAEVAKQFFDNNWIDAGIKRGKQSGAFCASVTPDSHPLVLVNFSGHVRDVQTLAHELGHGINDWLMRKQSYINYGVPLTLAETASVFAEMLVFDDLRDKITDKTELLSLYMGKIEDTFSTVFRQVAMYKFEQDIHRIQKEKGELTAADFGQAWQERQQEMFGKSVEMGGDYKVWWSYIPHFLHTPFYVYAYAFGELLVLSLYARYKKEGKSFISKYLKLMEAGTSKTPQELLKDFGISLEDPNFWEEGLATIRELVDKAKSLHGQK